MHNIPTHIINAISAMLSPYMDVTSAQIENMLYGSWQPIKDDCGKSGLKIYSRKDLAKALTVNPVTIDRAIKAGVLSCKHIGRRILIEEKDVRKWLNQK